jgi:eukaryotic-like serine/threonine-protein kinase
LTLAAGTTIGKYTVLRKIAEGGMAEIYLCSARGPEGFEKEVAVKRIRPFLANDKSFVSMFVAEARVAAQLNHSNIVQIFDFGELEGTYFLAMEYVSGQSLWHLSERATEQKTRLPVALVAQIGADIARGLHYAHRLTDKERGTLVGLVHRDVTPHNILLSYDGAVKLADFGIAKVQKLTSPGMLKGKFAYMAPEQARGDDIDARTDIFALGIVLWECLTGEPLFDGPSDVSVLRAVQEREILPPSAKNPEVGPELDAAVSRALQRDPTQRFQTAHELERALTQYVRRSGKDIDETDVALFLKRMFPPETFNPEKAQEAFSDTAISQKGPVPQSTPSPSPSPSGTAILERPTTGTPSPTPAHTGGSTQYLQRPSNTGSNPGGGVAPTHTPRPSPVSQSQALPVTPPGPSSRLPLIIAATSVIVASVAGAVVYLQRPAPAPTVPEVAPKPSIKPPPPKPVDPEPEPERPPLAKPLVPDAGAPVAKKPPVEERPRLEGKGVLRIRVAPWAEVFINGKRVGEVTGSRRFTLPVGPTRVKFVHSQRQQEVVANIDETREALLEFSAFGP